MKEITTNKTILNETSDILKDFFRDIDKYPIYSGEEQVQLAREAKSGNEKSREKLINSNLRFVVTCAKKYIGQGVPLLDLIQAGMLGLSSIGLNCLKTLSSFVIKILKILD